ncbi:hypothetical protein [Hippea sp. KM1]|uniref:hypothetical protein n=1 Tax=Hippea sp. KM1 TaxID=944481 RepID=UPI00046CDF00|nr:hypothetical protein [Hippea sp. KM1]
MRGFVFSLLFLFLLHSVSFAIDIVFVAPMKGEFSSYSRQMYNGLKLSLPAGISISEIDELNEDFVDAVAAKNPKVIIGPFFKGDVDNLTETFCSKPVLVLLPFAKQDTPCPNVFHYGFDPLSAASQLAQQVCSLPIGSVISFYGMDRLSQKEHDVFIDSLNRCGGVDVESYGLPSFVNLLGSVIKEAFDIRKINRIGGLTEKKIFQQEVEPDRVVIFAPPKVMVNFLSMVDYYDVKSGGILGLTTQMTPGFARLNATATRGVRLMFPYFLCNKDDLNKGFVDQYRKMFFEDPTQFSALGFDIGNILLQLFAGKNIKELADQKLVMGKLLFFSDDNNGVIDYPIFDANEVRLCAKQTSNR